MAITDLPLSAVVTAKATFAAAEDALSAAKIALKDAKAVRDNTVVVEDIPAAQDALDAAQLAYDTAKTDYDAARVALKDAEAAQITDLATATGENVVLQELVEDARIKQDFAQNWSESSKKDWKVDWNFE